MSYKVFSQKIKEKPHIFVEEWTKVRESPPKKKKNTKGDTFLW